MATPLIHYKLVINRMTRSKNMMENNNNQVDTNK